jgi:hypothetical protein
MPPRGSRIFVDTNAIYGAHRFGVWNALRNAYKLETVEKCLEEVTRMDKHGHRLVDRDRDELAAEFVVIHKVTYKETLALQHVIQGRVDLDVGEEHLLATAWQQKHAVWYLCGPDFATVNAMHLLKIIDKMCSLESLADATGMRGKVKDQWTEKWLNGKRTDLELGSF